MNRAPRLVLGLVLISSGIARAADGPASMPRSTPERQGVSSASILDFVDSADSKLDSLNSVMVVRHGQVVAEGWWAPYDAESRHELFSLSKSFTSTAVGIAIAEGKMTLDDSVLEAFPGEGPTDPSANLKAMRVRDLLRMSAGHQGEMRISPDTLSAKNFLARPVPFKPGTFFLYNTPATFMASAMVQKATGQSVLDYLKPRLFEPLGIVDPTWDANFQGISLGGYGLSVRTEDVAKFGQLYLQKGEWDGKQLVPAAWVEEATARQTSNGSNPKSDWEQGYGYQFWRCRNGAYRGDGAFGQYCIVMPEQDAVIAITSGLGDMQAVLNLVWDKILPGLKPGPLPEDAEGAERLRARLKGLNLRRPKGAATSTMLAQVSGKVYAFPSNERKVESLQVEAGSEPGTLAIVTRIDGRERRVECSADGWKKGTITLPTGVERKTASAGAWTSEDTYNAKVVLYETPTYIAMTLRFSGDEVFFDSKTSVRLGGVGPEPQLVGKKQ